MLITGVKKGDVYYVTCKGDEEPAFTICVLRPGVCDHCQIDILLGSGNENVTFAVVGGSGKVR
jgi:hypothetical protein